MTIKNSKFIRFILLSLLFGALSCLFVIPFFKLHYVPMGDDFKFHFDRLLNLSHNFRHLNFYPELATYGFQKSAYPLNAFYPWVTLIPFGLIFALIHNKVYAVALGIIFYLFVGLWITYVTTDRLFKNKLQAIITAIVYIFSEYTTSNIIARFALGEFFAMLFMPLVLYGLYAVTFGNSRDWPFLAWGGALICLSHVLSTFILVTFVVLILLIVFQKLPHKVKTLKSLMKAGILAFGISAIWILPFLRIQFSAQYSGMKGVILGYPLSQVINTSISSAVFAPNVWNKLYGIGILDIIILIMGLVQYKKLSNISKTSFIIAIVTLIMSSTTFPWRFFNNTFISCIQYSFRMLSLCTPFTAIVGGEMFSRFITQGHTINYQRIIGILTGIFVLWAGGYYQFFQPNGFLGKMRNTQSAFPITQTSFSLNEYTPLSEQKAVPNVIQHTATVNGRKVNLSSHEIKNTHNGELFDNKLINASKDVSLPVIFYKHIFKVYRNNHQIPVTNKDGQVHISRGSGPIRLAYNFGAFDIISIMLTLTSLLVLSPIILYRMKRINS